MNVFEKCLIDSKAGLYADDTHIYIYLYIYIFIYILNKLSANPKKTEYMIIRHPRKTNGIEEHDTLRLNDLDIKRVTNTKSLGIIVDEGLNWEPGGGANPIFFGGIRSRDRVLKRGRDRLL